MENLCGFAKHWAGFHGAIMTFAIESRFLCCYHEIYPDDIKAHCLTFGGKRLFQSSAKIRGTAACLMKEPGCFATSRLFSRLNFVIRALYTDWRACCSFCPVIGFPPVFGLYGKPSKNRPLESPVYLGLLSGFRLYGKRSFNV